MPFQQGNEYGAKAKLIDKTVRKLVVQDLNSPQPRLIRAINKVLDKASQGDIAALDWLTVRESGKPGSDDDNKSQLIQVVINGYADVQARIVDNSTGVADEGEGVVGGLLSDGGGGSREPVDGLPIHTESTSKVPINTESELSTVSGKHPWGMK